MNTHFINTLPVPICEERISRYQREVEDDKVRDIVAGFNEYIANEPKLSYRMLKSATYTSAEYLSYEQDAEN